MPLSKMRLHFVLFVLMIFCLAINACNQEDDSENVTLLAHINQNSGTGYNDCWGYTAPDGREYALLGVKNGTSIIDITDTDNLTEIAFITSELSGWKDIKTYKNYAYAVNESGGGLQIIDLSDLPNSASIKATYKGFSASHNIFIDVENGILYAEGAPSRRALVLSLADPEAPVKIAHFGIECHDIYVQESRAYISEGTKGSIGIYDMTDASSPTLLKRIEIPFSGYAHNAWLTEDGKYLMSTEETSNKTVKLWDIRDLDNVSITDDYLGPNNLAHNVYIKGNYAYLSHYESGLRIIDISNPKKIFEAGYYDTKNAWGAFPYFASGKILISDISKGLYIVKFSEPVGTDDASDVSKMPDDLTDTSVK